MGDTYLSPWVQTALWRSLQCYVGALLFVAALLAPSFVHCSLAGELNGAMSGIWVALAFGILLWAIIPAVVLGALGTFAPPRVWRWMCLVYIAGMVAFAIALTLTETGCAPVVI